MPEMPEELGDLKDLKDQMPEVTMDDMKKLKEMATKKDEEPEEENVFFSLIFFDQNRIGLICDIFFVLFSPPFGIFFCFACRIDRGKFALVAKKDRYNDLIFSGSCYKIFFLPLLNLYFFFNQHDEAKAAAMLERYLALEKEIVEAEQGSPKMILAHKKQQLEEIEGKLHEQRELVEKLERET